MRYNKRGFPIPPTQPSRPPQADRKGRPYILTDCIGAHRLICRAAPISVNFNANGSPGRDVRLKFTPWGSPLRKTYPCKPPPPPSRKVSPLTLGMLIVLVLLVVGATVGFVFFRNNQARTILPPSATPSTAPTTGNVVGSATATAGAFYSLYDTDTSSSLPTRNDPLSDNSQRLQWDEGQGCTFTAGAYHVSNAQSSGWQACMAHKSNFSNFLCQVQMTISKGSYGAFDLLYQPAICLRHI
jgi:hypothetical protein